MTWRRDKLPELVRAMSGRPRHEASGRPRHEALRGHVTELLREGFGAPYDEIAHELTWWTTAAASTRCGARP